MKKFKHAMKVKFLSKKIDNSTLPIFDEARYNKIIKNLDAQKAEMIKAMERVGADLSSV